MRDQRRRASADEYETALRYVAKVCCAAQLEPSYVDVGGGLPVPRADAAFDLGRFVAILAETAVILPTVREVWLENGRFMTARAGALAVRVLDRKQRGDRTYLIFDGGRINHARMAALRQHDILLDPPRDGPTCWTTVCGPTSAGVDRLGTWQLPAALQPGDVIVWLNAGAYHIPLETRFSVGVAPVVWFGERGDASVVRRRETAREWWGMWA